MADQQSAAAARGLIHPEEIERSAHVLSVLMEETVDSFYLKDRSGRYLAVNRPAARVLGVEPADLIGRYTKDVFPPAVGARLAAEDEAIMASGVARTYEHIIPVDGVERRWLSTKAPFRNEAGEVAGLVGVSRDITELKRAGEKLVEVNSMLSAVIEGTTSVVFVKDLESRYVLGNPALESVIARPLSEILGKDDTALVSPDVAKRFMEDDRRIIETGERVTYEESFGEGEHARLFLTTKGPRRDHEGKIVGVYGIAREITDTKRAQREIERLLEREKAARLAAQKAEAAAHDLARRLGNLQSVLEAALRHVDLGAMLRDVGERIKVAFEVDTVAFLFLEEGELWVRQAIGLEEAVRVGLHFPADRGIAGRVVAAGKAVFEEDISNVELASPILRDAGVTSLLAIPLRLEDRVIGVAHIGTFRRRSYEPEDVRLFQLIGDRVAVAADHAVLYKKAEEASRAREEIMAVVSHDLKSPLSAIVTSLTAVDRILPPGDGPGARARAHIASIRRSVDRMTRLVRDVLDVARMRAGSFTLKRDQDHAPGTLIDDAIDLLQPLADQKSLKIERHIAPSLPALKCDRDAIVRVVSNLLGNAIKFTPEAGSIQVGVGRLADTDAAGSPTCAPPGGLDGAAVRFYVRDTGPGITEEDLENVFDPYWRAKRLQSGGSGLGLAIARGIVEGHGGAIWADSSDAGSCFCFTLPVETGQARANERGQGDSPVLVRL